MHNEGKAQKGTHDGTRLVRLMNYCARQERSLLQVRDWMHRHGIEEHEAREWEQQLVRQGYVNEERFAALYARSKMRQKKWGWVKIRIGLQRHGLPDYQIEAALSALGVEEPLETLHKLAATKWTKLSAYSGAERRLRLIRYLIGRGYTAEQSRAEAEGLDRNEGEWADADE